MHIVWHCPNFQLIYKLVFFHFDGKHWMKNKHSWWWLLCFQFISTRCQDTTTNNMCKGLGQINFSSWYLNRSMKLLRPWRATVIFYFPMAPQPIHKLTRALQSHYHFSFLKAQVPHWRTSRMMVNTRGIDWYWPYQSRH